MQSYHPGPERTLREHLAKPGPTATLVSGPAAVGKTSLLRRALADHGGLWLRGSDLPAPLLAREHHAALAAAEGSVSTSPSASEGPWRGFGEALGRYLSSVDPGEAVVVWDRADPLLADRRWREMLQSVWADLRAHARSARLILVARHPGGADPLPFLGISGGPVLRLELRPLALREATGAFEGWSALDRLVAYGLLGGEPRIWDLLDPGVRLGTNLARLLLEPGAPLREFPRLRFPLPGRTPGRALALLGALADGAEEWGELREGARVFRTSSELGPYMKSLQEGGLVVAHRSLDAEPGSRGSRYRLVDPFLAFWTAVVHPLLAELDGGASPQGIWRDRIRPRIPELVSRRLPDIVVDHLRRHGGERLRAPAREAGALWGEGYDLPLAGTLSSGAAFYGFTSWEDPGPHAPEHLAEEVRETRYGYGRQIRLLLLFVVRDVSHALERNVARGSTSLLFRPDDLVAAPGSPAWTAEPRLER